MGFLCTFVPNNSLNEITFADINIKKDIFEEHNLKEGIFVKMYMKLMEYDNKKVVLWLSFLFINYI